MPQRAGALEADFGGESLEQRGVAHELDRVGKAVIRVQHDVAARQGFAAPLRAAEAVFALRSCVVGGPAGLEAAVGEQAEGLVESHAGVLGPQREGGEVAFERVVEQAEVALHAGQAVERERVVGALREGGLEGQQGLVRAPGGAQDRTQQAMRIGARGGEFERAARHRLGLVELGTRKQRLGQRDEAVGRGGAQRDRAPQAFHGRRSASGGGQHATQVEVQRGAAGRHFDGLPVGEFGLLRLPVAEADAAQQVECAGVAGRVGEHGAALRRGLFQFAGADQSLAVLELVAEDVHGAAMTDGPGCTMALSADEREGRVRTRAQESVA